MLFLHLFIVLLNELQLLVGGLDDVYFVDDFAAVLTHFVSATAQRVGSLENHLLLL